MPFEAFSTPTRGWRTPPMKHKNASIQPDLFEQDEPRVLPALSQKEQLATLVEALLLEIAAALASGEVGDDQDHGGPPGPQRLRLHPPVDGRSASAQPGEPPPSVRARRSCSAARLDHGRGHRR